MDSKEKKQEQNCSDSNNDVISTRKWMQCYFLALMSLVYSLCIIYLSGLMFALSQQCPIHTFMFPLLLTNSQILSYLHLSKDPAPPSAKSYVFLSSTHINFISTPLLVLFGGGGDTTLLKIKLLVPNIRI